MFYGHLTDWKEIDLLYENIFIVKLKIEFIFHLKLITMKVSPLFLYLMIFCNSLAAQESQNHINASSVEVPTGRGVCGTQSPGEGWEQAFQSLIENYKENLYRNRNFQATYTIPVIVHILYNGTTEGTVGKGANIYAAQVKAQIDALNDAFAGNAAGNASLPAPFSKVDANDIPIRFCLAVKDKDGKTLAEPGIERIDWKAKGWSSATNGSDVINYYDSKVKPSTIWDHTKYLNIWLGDFFTPSGGTKGYAKFPASSTLPNNFGSLVGNSKNDGVVMATRCFGNKTKFPGGYYADSFNNGAFSYGMTTVHEVGHWLGLHHISGDAQCGNDYCADTPPQKGGNGGCGGGLNWHCPKYPFQANQCSGNSNGEMFQNFMDYTDDHCQSLFTANQATRMMTAMANSPNRKLLGTHGLCAGPTGVATIENSLKTLQVYPNPNDGSFTVTFSSIEKSTCQLELRNVLGQVVYTERVADFTGIYSKQLNAEGFGKGIYILSVANSENKIAKKVIVH